MPSVNEINKELAIFLAQNCTQAYNQYMTNGKFYVPKEYSLVKGFKAKVLGRPEWFGFIIKSSKDIIVAFRGSVSRADWRADLEASQINYDFVTRAGKTHNRFYNYI